jgi:signal transduction histidine kinase
VSPTVVIADDRLASGKAARSVFGAAGAGLGVALGLLAESGQPADPAIWVPDLAVGWVFIASGLLAWHRRPSSRAGLLLTATGAAWFLPNFSSASPSVLAWVAGHCLYLHRGPLVHVLLTFPTGRAGSRLQRGAVAVGYVAALAPVAWGSDPVAIVLSAALVGVGHLDHRRARGRVRLARRTGLLATELAALVMGGGAAVRLIVPADRVLAPVRWIVEVSLAGVAVWLMASLLAARWDKVSMTDLVVELGDAPSDGLRDDLARVLGDPGLDVLYRVADHRWVDATGHDVPLPGPGTGRSVTLVRGEGHPIAALVHDPAVLDTPALVEAVRAAARLAVANARLQAQVRVQVEELAASRRRLLAAADDERRRLEQRLHDGARSRLDELTATLSTATTSTSDRDTRSHLAAAEAELLGSLDDLARLARGLHPRELSELGLDGALRALAGRSPLPVSVTVEIGQIPPVTAAAAYYLCLEGLTNVVKHARASRVSIVAGQVGDHLRVELIDDGIGGGADLRGAGLTGLADRIETLGGSLSVDSPGGEGTRLAARIPLG